MVVISAATAAVAAVAVTGCDPVGGMNASAVSITTDQLATAALKQDKVDVQWLSCSATMDNPTASAGATARNVASVDCRGETADRQKITVTGRVTENLDGLCVRGHLTGKVGTRTVFDANVLGDCSRRPSASGTQNR